GSVPSVHLLRRIAWGCGREANPAVPPHFRQVTRCHEALVGSPCRGPDAAREASLSVVAGAESVAQTAATASSSCAAGRRRALANALAAAPRTTTLAPPITWCGSSTRLAIGAARMPAIIVVRIDAPATPN